MEQRTKAGFYFTGFIFAISLTACSNSGGGSIQSSTASPETMTETLVKKLAPHAPYGSANNPGILEPVLTALTGSEVRIPNTDQVDNGVQVNVVGDVVSNDATDAFSILGHPITHVASPNDDLEKGLQDLSMAASNDDQAAMTEAARDLQAILMGTTEGRIYDGFPMLNYNYNTGSEPFVAGQEAGEYKMKVIRDTGETALGIDGLPRKIWEVDVNMLWYDDQFDADTFLIRVPVTADKNDTLRVNYKIYSLVREEFSPATVMSDQKTSVSMPFKGFDSAWIPVQGNTVTEITLDHPPLGMLRGVYTWGWRQHPPRIHFLQPIFEIINAHTGNIELEPQGKSFAMRNRMLRIDSIGKAAPEKKILTVAQAVLSGTPSSPAEIFSMLNESDVGPKGVWQEWADLAKNQRQLPPEARKILADEGIAEGFGPYDFVSVYLNNEMYGDGPLGSGRIEAFAQGDRRTVKVINLDHHTHYFRNVDFGKPLHDDISQLSHAGSQSFEIFNFKPSYGAPKAAEMQWRAGWGFRPHFDVIQQDDVFPRPEDQALLLSFEDGSGNIRKGYQFSTEIRQGDFRFNPPPFIIGTSLSDPSLQRLKETDGSNGLVIGQLTEGYGLAKMCANDEAHPIGTFCGRINPLFNPHGKLNFPPSSPMELRFPPFLRNPNPEGGDIIAPTPTWKPFLWINPNNGTLFIDPTDESKGYWSDLTFAHGSPIQGNSAITAKIEAPRASGEVFYQFDDLFHDNAIFSPHAR